MIKLQITYKFNGTSNSSVTLRECGPYTELVSEHGERIGLVESARNLVMFLNDMADGVYA